MTNEMLELLKFANLTGTMDECLALFEQGLSCIEVYKALDAMLEQEVQQEDPIQKGIQQWVEAQPISNLRTLHDSMVQMSKELEQLIPLPTQPKSK